MTFIKHRVLQYVVVLSILAVGFFFAVREKQRFSSEETQGGLRCPECNIVIISLTNTRKDHVGIYGYDQDTTPHIDTFFKNSLVFNNAFAPTSWTLPNAVSWFTGLFPYSHGVMNRYVENKLNPSLQTFPMILQENGYKTAAFTGNGDHNRRLSGMDKEFDVYVDGENYADYGVDVDFSSRNPLKLPGK